MKRGRDEDEDPEMTVELKRTGQLQSLDLNIRISLHRVLVTLSSLQNCASFDYLVQCSASQGLVLDLNSRLVDRPEESLIRGG